MTHCLETQWKPFISQSPNVVFALISNMHLSTEIWDAKVDKVGRAKFFIHACVLRKVFSKMV